MYSVVGRGEQYLVRRYFQAHARCGKVVWNGVVSLVAGGFLLCLPEDRYCKKFLLFFCGIGMSRHRGIPYIDVGSGWQPTIPWGNGIDQETPFIYVFSHRKMYGESELQQRPVIKMLHQKQKPLSIEESAFSPVVSAVRQSARCVCIYVRSSH